MKWFKKASKRDRRKKRRKQDKKREKSRGSLFSTWEHGDNRIVNRPKKDQKEQSHAGDWPNKNLPLIKRVKKEPKTSPAEKIPQDPNVRDIYRMTEPTYQKWQEVNKEKQHFLMTPFIDNIYKVHRPGKLTYRRKNVPIQEIAEWCKAARAEKVSDAFVLLSERDLNEYYSIRDERGKVLKRGKDVLIDTYDAYGIRVHNLPIRDFGTPRMSKMIETCRELKKVSEEAALNGNKVVVHCSAGIGRTGLVTSCYLVYTDRLNSLDLDAIKDNDTISRLGKFYHKKPSPISLTQTQKKVWYDTTSQLNFIIEFAKSKDKYEKAGKRMDDPEVIEQIKKQDKEREKEELKKWEEMQRDQYAERAFRSTQKFESPKGSIDDWWKQHTGKKDDDIIYDIEDIYNTEGEGDEENWVRGADGNWYLAEELPNIIDPDMPSSSYEPYYMQESERQKIEDIYNQELEKEERNKLKRRNRKKKRNYTGVSDEIDDRFYDDPKEFSIETIDDDEWLSRFGDGWFKKLKEGQSGDGGWFERFRMTRNDEQDDYNYAPFDNREIMNENFPIGYCPITPVKGNNIFKGKRPGYPSRKKIPTEVVENCAKKMKDQGITDVFVFLNDKELDLYYDNILFPVYEKNGLVIHHYPIEDFSVPSIEMAREFVVDLDNTIKNGGSALLHCSAGIGRTGIMLSAYDIYKKESPRLWGQRKEQVDFINDFKRNI